MANPFSLEGKNAWITGASYGIGFNIAKGSQVLPTVSVSTSPRLL